MAAKTSSPASAFIKVLRSFETGGFTHRDVVAELRRLLKAGASPTELSEILLRREFVEPLPVDAHKEVLGLLEAAKEPKLITAPVEIPVGGATHTPTRARGSPSAVTPPKRSPAADGLVDVVARAITLVRISASPARTSALSDSVRRRNRRIAPDKAGVSAPTPRKAPIATLIPPAEKSVTNGKPAQAGLLDARKGRGGP